MKPQHARFNFMLQQHMNDMFVTLFKQIDDLLNQFPFMRQFMETMIGK